MENRYVICGKSALNYWRAQFGASPLAENRTAWHEPRNCDERYKQASELLVALGLPAPLDIVVPNSNLRKTSSIATYHYFNHRVSQEDVEQIADDVLVCKPALAIAQNSVRTPVYEVLLLMLEFCGTYLISPGSEAGFVNIESPLLSVENFREVFGEKGRVPRYGKTRRDTALGLLAAGSNSPAESAIYTMLSLPTTLGGYEVPGIELNQPVTLSTDAQEMLGCEKIRPDFLLPGAMTAGEYKSRAFHPEGTWTNDDRRIDALEASGYHTFTLNNERVRNLKDLGSIATTLLARLGISRPKPDASILSQQLDLHRHLFSTPHKQPASPPSTFGKTSRY